MYFLERMMDTVKKADISNLENVTDNTLNRINNIVRENDVEINRTIEKIVKCSFFKHLEKIKIEIDDITEFLNHPMFDELEQFESSEFYELFIGLTELENHISDLKEFAINKMYSETDIDNDIIKEYFDEIDYYMFSVYDRMEELGISFTFSF